MSGIPMFEPAKPAYVSGGRLVWIAAYAAALQAILNKPMASQMDVSTFAATHADAALREYRKRANKGDDP